MLPLAVLLVLFAVWEASVRLLAIPVYILPAPSRILAATWDVRGAVLMHGMATLWTVLAGLSLIHI